MLLGSVVLVSGDRMNIMYLAPHVEYTERLTCYRRIMNKSSHIFISYYDMVIVPRGCVPVPLRQACGFTLTCVLSGVPCKTYCTPWNFLCNDSIINVTAQMIG